MREFVEVALQAEGNEIKLSALLLDSQVFL